MAFTIHSSDGRLRICTYGAGVAAGHVERLRKQGVKVSVTDINGRGYGLGTLQRQAAEVALIT